MPFIKTQNKQPSYHSRWRVCVSDQLVSDFAARIALRNQNSQTKDLATRRRLEMRAFFEMPNTSPLIEKNNWLARGPGT